jgi:rubrerythrin
MATDPTTGDVGQEQMGAVEELVRDDMARKKFLRMAGAGAATSFGTFVLAACGTKKKAATATTTAAAAASSKGDTAGDLAILNYALTLEYLETQFYSQVIAANLFKGAPASLLKSFGAQEQAHVDALKATVTKLGGTPVPAPMGKFPVATAEKVALLAYTVENLGANAYLGQAGAIKNKDVLAAALSIHTVEARHAATLATLVKKPISPDGAFAKPADMKTVLAAVKPFLA